MDRPLDHATRDLQSSKLKLVDELIVVPQPHGTETFFHLELPSKSRFFRVGQNEYTFLSLLDGRLTFAQAITRMTQSAGSQTLSQTQALEVLHFALENGLLRFVDAQIPFSPRDAEASPVQKKPLLRILSRCNPLWLRIPLGNPTRMLVACEPWLGWLFTPLASAIGVGLITFATLLVFVQRDRFARDAEQIFSTSNWVWLGAAWLVLKVLHELGHGLAAQRYRAESRQWGLVLAFFMPSAYIDVTACWRFVSRWQRMHVAAAGMFVELLVASLAAIAWSHGWSPAASHLLVNVILMASLSTLFFNLNPLLKLDGYYLLSDALGIPNLAAEGQRRVTAFVRRAFFGGEAIRATQTGAARWFVPAYGCGAIVWRWAICTSMLVVTATLWKGAGVALCVIGIVTWFAQPLTSIWTECSRRFRESRTDCFRAGLVATSLLLVLTAAALWLPWPGTLTVAGVVDYSDAAIVRSPADGFIARVLVEEGQPVTAGTPLLELCNDDLAAEFRELEATLSQNEFRRRAAHDRHSAAELQVADADRAALQQRRDELAKRRAGLLVRAPVAGRVIARNLSQQIDRYVHEGDQLIVIGDEARKELVLSLPQNIIQQATPIVSQSVRFRIGAHRQQTGVLERIAPRATREIPHAALSATNGGPLAVAPRTVDDEPIATRDDQYTDDTTRLLEPHFRAVITLPPDISRTLASGQRAHALLGWATDRCGEHLWKLANHWVRQQIESQRLP